MEEGHVWQGRRNRYSSPGCQLARWSFDFTDPEDVQTGRFGVGRVAESRCSRLNALPGHLYGSPLFLKIEISVPLVCRYQLYD